METGSPAVLRQIAGPRTAPAAGAVQVVVAGAIASGKTTLARALAETLGLPVHPEHPQENPFLERFYADRGRWALPSQLWFIADSADQHRQVHKGEGAVQDHSIYENVHVFGAAMADLGILAPDEWDLLKDVTGPILDELPYPNLVVLVDAPLETLLDRIAARGREYEVGIDAEYLTALHRRRWDLFTAWQHCPVLLLDSVNTNLHRSDEVEMIAAGVADFLP